MSKIVSNKKYFILVLIFLIVMLLVFYSFKWYKTTRYYNDSIISDVLPEIKKNEIENYLQENPNIFIYLTSIKNQNRKFEKQLKTYINQNNLSKNIVFINVDNINLKELKDYNIDIIPNLILINNSKLEKILYIEGEKLDINDFKEFIESND